MAILATIGGNSAQQKDERVFDPRQGESQNIEIKGSPEVILPLYQQCKTIAGYTPSYESVKYSNDKGRATLVLSVRGGGSGYAAVQLDNGIALYEYQCNEITSPIESHPHFASLTSAQVALVLQTAQELEQPGSTWSALGLELYQCLIHGMTTYQLSQPVLRETITVSNRTAIRNAKTGVDQVDSSFPPAAAANSILAPFPAGEWIKKSVVIRQISKKLWELNTEWWWTQKASKIIYGGSLEFT